ALALALDRQRALQGLFGFAAELDPVRVHRAVQRQAPARLAVVREREDGYALRAGAGDQIRGDAAPGDHHDADRVQALRERHGVDRDVLLVAVGDQLALVAEAGPELG